MLFITYIIYIKISKIRKLISAKSRHFYKFYINCVYRSLVNCSHDEIINNQNEYYYNLYFIYIRKNNFGFIFNYTSPINKIYVIIINI